MPTIATPALALHGGEKTIPAPHPEMFHWPIVTAEDEAAVLEVLRAGKMSGTEVTLKFEQEFAAWHGMKHALALNNGTAALHSAMWACGVRDGDEVIGPSMTFWASVLPALNLGARVVFADVDAQSLTLDPADVEKKITPRTKAIIAVHYAGHPCDMDALTRIAKNHGVKLIEDVSHAHGALYKGRLVGTFGDVAAMSVMSGKAFACGEGGMLITNDSGIYERAVAFGHYERTGGATRFTEQTETIQDLDLKKYAGVPLGGFKYRMHQLSSAVGRGQLKHYAARMNAIQNATNRFWELLEGTPGVRPHRIDKNVGTMGGWYMPLGLYAPEELRDTPVEKFCEAVRAEGCPCNPGANKPLHRHPVFNEADIYGRGVPSRAIEPLPVTDTVPGRVFQIPWFKHDRPEIIQQYANAVKKVAQSMASL